MKAIILFFTVVPNDLITLYCLSYADCEAKAAVEDRESIKMIKDKKQLEMPMLV